MSDERGLDDKLQCVRCDDSNWKHVKSAWKDRPQQLRDEIAHCFSIYREVLAESARTGERSPELALPVAVGLALVDEDGPVLAAVADEVGLAVTVYVQPANPHAARDGATAPQRHSSQRQNQ